MALADIKTEAGKRNGKSRWNRRVVVKTASKKLRRHESKKLERNY